MISSEIKLWLPAAKSLNRWTTLTPENDESLQQLRRLIKEENQVFLPPPHRCVRTHARPMALFLTPKLMKAPTTVHFSLASAQEETRDIARRP